MGHRSRVHQPGTVPRAHRRCRGRCLDKSGSSSSSTIFSPIFLSSLRSSIDVRSSTTKSQRSPVPPSRVVSTVDAELEHVPSWRRYRNADRWSNGGPFAFRWRQRRLGYCQVDPEIVQDLSWIIRVIIFSFLRIFLLVSCSPVWPECSVLYTRREKLLGVVLENREASIGLAGPSCGRSEDCEIGSSDERFRPLSRYRTCELSRPRIYTDVYGTIGRACYYSVFGKAYTRSWRLCSFGPVPGGRETVDRWFGRYHNGELPSSHDIQLVNVQLVVARVHLCSCKKVLRENRREEERPREEGWTCGEEDST